MSCALEHKFPSEPFPVDALLEIFNAPKEGMTLGAKGILLWLNTGWVFWNEGSADREKMDWAVIGPDDEGDTDFGYTDPNGEKTDELRLLTAPLGA